MKRKMLRLLALLCALAVLFSMLTISFADFGGFSGDGDYGGGSDSDGGGDYGGYDSDYGDYGSHSSSSGGSSGGFFIFMPLFIGGIFLLIKLAGKKSSSTTVATKPMPRLRPMEEYRGVDPQFDEAALTQKLSNLYVQMQHCWTDKDISSLRPYFTDACFAQMDRQLDAFRKRGMTNYVDRIAVLNVKLEGFCQSEGNDHIYATLNTRIVDYTLNDKTGERISGSKTVEKFMTYRWHLIRPTGEHTEQELGGTRSLNCPHCGAPLNVNESAKCPYCDSVITVEKHGFVLTELQGIAQRSSK